MEKGVVKYYRIPTRFDYKEIGYLWYHETPENELEIFIQISPDKDHPDWQRLGFIMEKIYLDNATPQDFFDKILELYRNISEQNGPQSA